MNFGNIRISDQRPPRPSSFQISNSFSNPTYSPILHTLALSIHAQNPPPNASSPPLTKPPKRGPNKPNRSPDDWLEARQSAIRGEAAGGGEEVCGGCYCCGGGCDRGACVGAGGAVWKEGGGRVGWARGGIDNRCGGLRSMTSRTGMVDVRRGIWRLGKRQGRDGG